MFVCRLFLLLIRRESAFSRDNMLEGEPFDRGEMTFSVVIKWVKNNFYLLPPPVHSKLWWNKYKQKSKNQNQTENNTYLKSRFVIPEFKNFVELFFCKCKMSTKEVERWCFFSSCFFSLRRWISVFLSLSPGYFLETAARRVTKQKCGDLVSIKVRSAVH